MPGLGKLTPVSRSQYDFDITNERSLAALAASLKATPIHLLICATGVLTVDDAPPEKSLRQIRPEIMAAHFAINAIGPALVAKHFLPLLDRQQRSVAAFLSARVGSIGDNRLGGWISYRASKAALNQIVHTAAIELSRSHPQAAVVAVHPGTVQTGLSAPYSSGHKTVSSIQAAQSILNMLDGLTPSQSGGFFAYDGSKIEW